MNEIFLVYVFLSLSRKKDGVSKAVESRFAMTRGVPTCILRVGM